MYIICLVFFAYIVSSYTRELRFFPHEYAPKNVSIKKLISQFNGKNQPFLAILSRKPKKQQIPTYVLPKDSEDLLVDTPHHHHHDHHHQPHPHKGKFNVFSGAFVFYYQQPLYNYRQTSTTFYFVGSYNNSHLLFSKYQSCGVFL